MMKIRFDFRNFQYCFTNPLQIIQAFQVNEVLDCLQQVEQAVRAGNYAIGFLSYEAAPAFRSYFEVYPQGKLPLLWFAIFDQPVQQSIFASDTYKKSLHPLEWMADTPWSEYQQTIQTIKDRIASGDSYQINYTLRAQVQFNGDPYHHYLQLLSAQQAEYCAYIDSGDFQILSASPELFFEIKADSITCKPMKGTVARGVTNEEDIKQRSILHNDKNHAENLMIVDLLRNDLGQIAQQGTVKVTSLFDTEKYPTVWQLTSTIRANLRKGLGVSDIFQALFPCGSVTGAPKVSTMKLIRQLEKQPRGIYCGALGMISPNGQAIFSVPIRTVLVQEGQATYGVGGGITWDSTDVGEYQEIMHKMQVLYQSKSPEFLLESLLLENGYYFLYDEHLERLKDSAHYFDFSYSLDDLENHLACIAKQYPYPKNSWKIRLLIGKEGKITSEIEKLSLSQNPIKASWSPIGMHSRNPFLYHKTSLRDFYPKITDGHEFLLFNEKEEVTEFVNGNIVLNKEGEWITPPIHSGLLKGTMREHLLRKGAIIERVIRKRDILPGCQMAFINSVRGWRKVSWEK